MSAPEADDKDDLPKLYRLVSQQLQIAPSQYSEEDFKRILGGLHERRRGTRRPAEPSR